MANRSGSVPPVRGEGPRVGAVGRQSVRSLVPEEVLSALFGTICSFADQRNEDPARALHIPEGVMVAFDGVEIRFHRLDDKIEHGDPTSCIRGAKRQVLLGVSVIWNG